MAGTTFKTNPYGLHDLLKTAIPVLLRLIEQATGQTVYRAEEGRERSEQAEAN